jgi:hypothetical protein
MYITQAQYSELYDMAGPDDYTDGDYVAFAQPVDWPGQGGS